MAMASRDRSAAMEPAAQQRSVPELFSDLVGQVSTLFRKEVQLARVEVSEKLNQAMVGVAFMIGGGVLLIAALGVLLAAAVDALDLLVGEPWGALIVGGIVAIIGALLIRSGMGSMTNLTPEKTVEQLGRDAAVAREQTR